MISFHPEVIFAFINQIIADTAGKNILYVFWYFFIHGVWIFFIYPVGYLLWTLWIDSRNTKHLSTINYTYLSVDIPADNEQMPKAVEQIFATIAGAHASMTKGEEWWEGKVQLSFSFEWVSQTRGDGLGYDILSRNTNGTDRYIEVKSTKLTKESPFYFSALEYDFSKRSGSDFFLYRIFNLKAEPKLFICNGAYDQFCNIRSTKFKGSF
jgi:hypothetical protein